MYISRESLVLEFLNLYFCSLFFAFLRLDIRYEKLMSVGIFRKEKETMAIGPWVASDKNSFHGLIQKIMLYTNTELKPNQVPYCNLTIIIHHMPAIHSAFVKTDSYPSFYPALPIQKSYVLCKYCDQTKSDA